MNQHIITWQDRTGCGDVSATHIGSTVLLMGWVDALRDHGDLLFIHLRDRSGMVQVVFNPEKTSSTICSQAASLRNEYCIAVRGQVIDRLPGTENPHIETGKIEVIAREMEVLSRSQTLPFIISEKREGKSEAGSRNSDETTGLTHLPFTRNRGKTQPPRPLLKFL